MAIEDLRGREARAVAGSADGAVVRGTQSFVGVMGEVWRRPLLTGREVAWRWGFWVAVALVLWARSRESLRAAWDGLAATEALVQHGGAVEGVDWGGVRHSWPWALVLGVAWAAAFAVGRAAVMRRAEPGCVGAGFGVRFGLALVRVAGFFVALGIWGWSVLKVGGVRMLSPLANGIDPTYVARFAGVVVITLVLFVLWAAGSWVWRLALTLAETQGMGFVAALRGAAASGGLGSGGLGRGGLGAQLVEVNLLMGIVKVSLLVLLLVFSASPLPFETVATQGFLVAWWALGAVIWFAVSDYFHVVRALVYLRFWQRQRAGMAS